MTSIGPQVAIATSDSALLNVKDIKSSLDYFELLQRAGVINKTNYAKNGVGAGILTYNIVLTAVRTNLQYPADLQHEDFGKVCCCVLVFELQQQTTHSKQHSDTCYF